MTETRRCKIVIVGGGPAGLATALHLAQLSPALAAETIIIEAAEHPRHKLCGGGITFHGEEQLTRLGLAVDVPTFTVEHLIFRLGAQAFTISAAQAMQVIQRHEFDAALARAVVDRGLELHLNERLLDLQVAADGVRLTTNRSSYETAVVVAADGANSMVRRKLRLFTSVGVARLLRVLTPIDPQTTTAWQTKTAVFDFSCIMGGIQGYVWDFPCLLNGSAYMNRGIFDSRIAPAAAQGRGHLKETFVTGLQARQINLEQSPLEGHPVRWFDASAEFSRPRVLFVGDAAGVDPLFAEGISYGIEYGEVAAAAMQNAFATGDYAFTDYRRRLLAHPLGKMLQRRALVARLLYTHRWPRLWTLFWRMAAVSPTAVQQAIGSSLALLPPKTNSRRRPGTRD
ncbi:MAG: NAD(P)/FAD-dependent oxidoreductase [Chloroflexi bacterium]|nr:NAD(P)/FAD-dependent oxidoreductase [Chloroflexota bacterium]